MLRDAGIEVRSTSGLPTGLLVVDDEGYIFTPVALYLESEAQTRDQALQAIADLATFARENASHLLYCLIEDVAHANRAALGAFTESLAARFAAN